MTDLELYPHQIRAINHILDTDFQSSVIQYATGTGKSLIGYELVSHFHTKYPKLNILWICEHKNALDQQFNTGKYKFNKSLIVQNYFNNKLSNWMDAVNSSYHIWKCTQLIVINRAYLTSNNNYQKLNIPIGLVIHDECHTASNSTSQLFYKWLFDKSIATKCIGLSATPNWIYPFDKLAIKYDFIDAIKDNVICKPLVFTLNSTYNTDTLFNILCELLNNFSSNCKIVIWCGTIANCNEMYSYWNNFVKTIGKFEYIHTYQDHSCNKDNTIINKFNDERNNAFLFCANKHREASDFKYLDGCVFLDGVVERDSKLFVQCLGRVLRKSENKTCGWIFDAHAFNIVECCERLLKFTNKSDDWKIVSDSIQLFNTNVNKITIDFITSPPDNIECNSISANNVKKYFIRSYPDSPEYTNRINK